MPTREKKENNSLVLKIGVAVAFSFAGFLFYRFRNKHARPSLPTHSSDVTEQAESRDEINDDVPSSPEMASNSEAHGNSFHQPTINNSSLNPFPCTVNSSNKEDFLLPEFNKLVQGLDISMDTHKVTKHVGTDEYVQEIESLRSIVTDLREQESSLEIKLLEYYGLKEQDMTVMELQNRLKIHNVRAKTLSLKIESLQAENRRLEAQVADYLRMVNELDSARAKIMALDTKVRSDAEQGKERIMILEKRIRMLELQEKDSQMATSSMRCEHDEVKLQRTEDLEIEREVLRKAKYELLNENSELAWRLEYAQTHQTPRLEDLEVGDLKKEVARLREENENLEKESQRLQTDRCSDVELVYFRWVNACLRYELRNYHPPPGKTMSRDLSKSPSPRSEAKAKQLILEYANNEENDLIYDHLEPSANASMHHSKKLNILAKVRRLITGKDKEEHHNEPLSLVRSRSVEDLGKAYSVIQRRNSISTSSQSLNWTRSSTSSSWDQRTHKKSASYGAF